MPDAVEAVRQDVDEEASDELMRLEGHGLVPPAPLGGLARRLADTVAAPDLEAGKRFLAKIIDPFPNRLVAACAAQRRGGREGEGAVQGMAPPLAGARVIDISEDIGK